MLHTGCAVFSHIVSHTTCSVISYSIGYICYCGLPISFLISTTWSGSLLHCIYREQGRGMHEFLCFLWHWVSDDNVKLMTVFEGLSLLSIVYRLTACFLKVHLKYYFSFLNTLSVYHHSLYDLEHFWSLGARAHTTIKEQNCWHFAVAGPHTHTHKREECWPATQWGHNSLTFIMYLFSTSWREATVGKWA